MIARTVVRSFWKYRDPVGSRTLAAPMGFQFSATVCFTRLKNPAYFHSRVLRKVASPTSTPSTWSGAGRR